MCTRHHTTQERHRAQGEERARNRAANAEIIRRQGEEFEANAILVRDEYWAIYDGLLRAGVDWEEVLLAISVEHRANRMNGRVTQMLCQLISIQIGMNFHLVWRAYIFLNHQEAQQLLQAAGNLAVAVPPLAARPDHLLQAVANDRQNVHTAVVTTQTNRGLDVLLKAVVPKDQYTIREVLVDWLTNRKDIKYDDIMRIEKDMRGWYNTKSCRVEKDWFYRRTLQGLWFIIKNHDHADELKKRLYEECAESDGLCCDGHINRLINVMVGFDPRFAPPLPVKEQLQNAMSAISMLDIDEDEKIMRATAIMMNLKIPEAEHQDWLSAF